MKEKEPPSPLWFLFAFLMIVFGVVCYGTYSSAEEESAHEFQMQVAYVDFMMQKAQLFDLEAELAAERGNRKMAIEQHGQSTQIRDAIARMDYKVVKEAMERRQVKQSVLN